MRKSVIPSRMKYGVYRSPHIFYLTGVQGRFLASLEMTISGKAVLSFSALETLFPPSLSYRQYPIRLASLATFPTRGRLCIGDSGTLANGALVTIPPRFHAATALSSPSWHLPHAGKALFVGIGFSAYPVFALAV